jgi:hypothetical protein
LSPIDSPTSGYSDRFIEGDIGVAFDVEDESSTKQSRQRRGNKKGQSKYASGTKTKALTLRLHERDGVVLTSSGPGKKERCWSLMPGIEAADIPRVSIPRLKNRRSLHADGTASFPVPNFNHTASSIRECELSPSRA